MPISPKARWVSSNLESSIIASIFFMLLPWCHSIIQLHLPLAEPSHTHSAAVMPAGASAKRIFAKRPIYKGFLGC
jgi:hypothetical protein